MKIALVLPYLKAGGTERQGSYIVNYLKNQGHDVTLICIEKKGSFKSLFNSRVVSLQSTHSNKKILLNSYLLFKLLKSLEVEVVISRAWSTNLLVSIASWASKVPCLLFLSGSLNLSEHGTIKKIIHRKTLKTSSKVISVSTAAKKNCIKWLDINESKISVIHNGVDSERVRPLSDKIVHLPTGFNEDNPTLLFIGRLIPRKGLDILLKAIDEIGIENKPVNLLVVGQGEFELKYKELTEKLGVRSNVFFVGEKENPFPYMRYSDIFILPSRSEGFPNVLLEAMAGSMAVVASDCETGPNEIIKSGYNGLLFETENSEDLAKKISMLLKDEELKTKCSKNAYSTVKEAFDLNNQMKKIENEVYSILRK